MSEEQNKDSIKTKVDETVKNETVETKSESLNAEKIVTEKKTSTSSQKKTMF